MSLKISEQRYENDVTVLEVKGEVDMSSASTMREHLVPALEAVPRGIVVELSGVTYMDSSGIATLVEGLQSSMKKSITFRLANLHPTVLDVFKLARLDTVFQVYDSVEDAMTDL